MSPDDTLAEMRRLVSAWQRLEKRARADAEEWERSSAAAWLADHPNHPDPARAIREGEHRIGGEPHPDGRDTIAERLMAASGGGIEGLMMAGTLARMAARAPATLDEVLAVALGRLSDHPRWRAAELANALLYWLVERRVLVLGSDGRCRAASDEVVRRMGRAVGP